MAAISSVEPAHAPIGAHGREQKSRTALAAGAAPRRSACARERERRKDDELARPGMLVDIKV